MTYVHTAAHRLSYILCMYVEGCFPNIWQCIAGALTQEKFSQRDSKVYCVVSYRIVWNQIVSFRIESDRFVSYRVISYDMESNCITLHRIISCISVNIRNYKGISSPLKTTSVWTVQQQSDQHLPQYINWYLHSYHQRRVDVLRWQEMGGWHERRLLLYLQRRSTVLVWRWSPLNATDRHLKQNLRTIQWRKHN